MNMENKLYPAFESNSIDLITNQKFLIEVDEICYEIITLNEEGWIRQSFYSETLNKISEVRVKKRHSEEAAIIKIDLEFNNYEIKLGGKFLRNAREKTIHKIKDEIRNAEFIEI